MQKRPRGSFSRPLCLPSFCTDEQLCGCSDHYAAMNRSCKQFILLLALVAGFASLAQAQDITLTELITETPSCAVSF